MTGGGAGRGSGTVDVLVWVAVVAAGSYLTATALLPLLLAPFVAFRAQVTWTWEPRPWLAQLLARWRRRRP
jgi:hypothetical protein